MRPVEQSVDGGDHSPAPPFWSMEKPMSKSIKLLAVLGLVLGVAACAQPQEEEFVAIEPITVEPMVTTGKFK